MIRSKLKISHEMRTVEYYAVKIFEILIAIPIFYREFSLQKLKYLIPIQLAFIAKRYPNQMLLHCPCSSKYQG